MDRLSDHRFREWIEARTSVVDHAQELADPVVMERLLCTISGAPILNLPSKPGDVEGVEGLWRRYQAQRRRIEEVCER